MNNKDLLNTDILRARIMNIEYENYNEKELESEIKRIYFEETGKEIPAEVTVYLSDVELIEYKKKSIDYGLDGTIIHFLSVENQLNQAITITRGSESREKDNWRPLDWGYNLKGIFVGANSAQFNIAKEFDEKVTTKILNQINSKTNLKDRLPKLKKLGFGHSLGGNNIVLLQMMSPDDYNLANHSNDTNFINQRFEDVYVINGAPPSINQLVKIDQIFLNKLRMNFNINSPKEINTIPTEKLKKFTEDYYKNKIDETTIHHITAEEDMLYNMTRVRGFIDIGVREDFLDTDPKFGGIKDIIEKIPDEEIIKIQDFMSEYSMSYNKDGFDGFIKEFTGFDPKIVDLKEEYSADGLNIVERGLILMKMGPMISDMSKKVPKFLEQFDTLNKNADVILQELVNTDYITLDDKKVIEESLNEIRTSLQNIDKALLIEALDFLDNKNNSNALLDSIINILSNKNIIEQRLKKLLDTFHVNVDAHGLGKVINTLAKDGRVSYRRHDMYLTKGSIKVNLSSAVRIYQKGMLILEEKRDAIQRLKTQFLIEYIDDYTSRKQGLMNRIHSMEANPKQQTHLLKKLYLPSDYYELKRVNIHEYIPAMPATISQTFDQMIMTAEQDLEEEWELVKKMRESIEELFEREEMITKIFDIK
ncbi:DUF6792 domain-containing protein [Metabacillus malikii]|uniref:DUF6792 domain-containing protein n=1 Tax=Metabacillus malikii TaxID=1504265 RepID=A0ABT9ZG10_9BACI|nr:DUF6792 domain-containing protein [Metabacillus malikii]MDQ0231219.1 hypothetical protein [Metabacillus malikii]